MLEYVYVAIQINDHNIERGDFVGAFNNRNAAEQACLDGDYNGFVLRINLNYLQSTYNPSISYKGVD